MCYCCRKLEIRQNRPLSHLRLSDRSVLSNQITSDSLTDLSYPIREHGLSRTQPLSNRSDSLAHGLSHFLMWSDRSVLSNQITLDSLTDLSYPIRNQGERVQSVRESNLSETGCVRESPICAITPLSLQASLADSTASLTSLTWESPICAREAVCKRVWSVWERLITPLSLRATVATLPGKRGKRGHEITWLHGLSHKIGLSRTVGESDLCERGWSHLSHSRPVSLILWSFSPLSPGRGVIRVAREAVKSHDFTASLAQIGLSHCAREAVCERVRLIIGYWFNKVDR